jgi:hypothetical protein
MAHLEFQSKIGSDGSLALNLPLGVFEANATVKVTVDSLGESNPISTSEWRQIIEETAGKWQGEPLERPEQGKFEQRDKWP